MSQSMLMGFGYGCGTFDGGIGRSAAFPIDTGAVLAVPGLQL